MGPVFGGRKCLCVFGAKCARVFFLGKESSEGSDLQAAYCDRLETATAVREFEGWIWAAVWLQSHENDSDWTIAFGLAHNVVIHWNWQADIILQRAACAEKCILYCGHFIGHRWSDLVLAAGTVFNQVVLWAPGKATISHCGLETGPQPVLHRLTGHQGVIFSIFYHEGLQRICSVSDDRSIIMYQLHSHPSSTQSFSDLSAVSVDWNHVTIEPMLNVFGHSGRVWDVVLLKDCFVSVGEDANCVVWNYGGEVLHKFKGHRGQSIWSLAASEDESFVVTGGGDCSIRKWQLVTKQRSPLAQSRLTIPDHVKTCSDDFVRSLALWDYDNIILITNAGSTLCYNIPCDEWHTVAQDVDFASYAILAVSQHTSFLAVGGISGHVRVMYNISGNEGAVCETKVKLHSGKVCGLTWVDADHFLTTGLQGYCVLAKVHLSAESKLAVSTVAQLELPVCRHRWVVSGCLLLTSVSPATVSSSLSLLSETETHLVCGDRSGSVHHYHLTYSASQAQAGSVVQPVQTFPKIHGSAGVTFVCRHKHTLYTTGRDGHYRRWTLNMRHLQLLNSSRVFKGFDWIDRLWITDHGLFILGFYSSRFLVWDADQGEGQLEVECGGGHRSWDCASRGHDYRFCFIKAREVIMVNSGQKSFQDIIKPFLHGKKIWDMKCLSTSIDEKGVVHHVLCTGSEDTTLSLGILQSDLERGHLQWAGQHTLHGHLSSVRSMAAVQSVYTPLNGERSRPDHGTNQDCLTGASLQPSEERNRFSNMCGSATVVFSGGGRAQIQAWRVAVKQEGQSHQMIKKQEICLSQTQDEQCRSSHNPVMNPTNTFPVTQQPQSRNITQEGSRENFVHTDFEHSFSSEATQDKVNSSLKEKTVDASCMARTVPRNKQSIFITSYEHLGGCFLGESRHKRSHKPWKTRYLKLDPETRVMCLAAVSAHQLNSTLSAYLHLVAAAGSDGVLRLFLFDELHRHFTLLCQSSHHNGCILKVLIHLHPYPSGTFCDNLPDQVSFLLSAATDGRIAIWNLQPVVRWLCSNTRQQKADPVVNTHRDEVGLQLKASEPRNLVKSTELTCRSSGNKSDSEVERTELTFPNSGNKTNSEVEQTEFRASVLENEAIPEVEQSEAADHQQFQAQDLTDDDGNSENEEDNAANMHCSTDIQSAMTKAQYLGDVQPPLFAPRPCAGNSSGAEESPAAEYERDQTTVEDGAHLSWIPDQELVAHQSGVNSLHIKSLADGSLLLASGGDDNALTIHRLTMAAQGKNARRGSRNWGPLFEVGSRICKADAHAAQITGVWVLSQTHVLTASVDQRVTLWSLTEHSQITLESCHFVNVADPSNIDVWEHKDRVYVGLCGEGVALFSIPSCAAEDNF